MNKNKEIKRPRNEYPFMPSIKWNPFLNANHFTCWEIQRQEDMEDIRSVEEYLERKKQEVNKMLKELRERRNHE